MLAVRYVALAELVLWLGSMVTIGALVAPSTFHVLQTSDPAGGRWLAGLVLGEVFRQFHLLAYACGAVLLVCLFLMKFVGPPPHAFVVRSALVASMLSLTLYSGLRVSPDIDRLQRQAPPSLHDAAAQQERRGQLEHLHRTATTLMTVNLVLALVLLAWYARE
jgi:hypothetical protein